jgi:hypothetical protein
MWFADYRKGSDPVREEAELLLRLEYLEVAVTIILGMEKVVAGIASDCLRLSPGQSHTTFAAAYAFHLTLCVIPKAKPTIQQPRVP